MIWFQSTKELYINPFPPFKPIRLLFVPMDAADQLPTTPSHAKKSPPPPIIFFYLLLQYHHRLPPPLLSTAPHLSMEERATISTNTNNHPNPDHQVIVQVQQPDLPAFMSGTYVVQIPKDKIYRVPPPENALIAERHRNNRGNNNNNNSNTNKRCCSRRLCWLLCFVVLVLLLGLIALVVYVCLIK